MPMLNRKELDQLERRELHLTVLAAVFVLVQAAGLAVLMYPLVFLRPDSGSKWTLRVAYFGFCVLTVLFAGYLLDRQRLVRKLKQNVIEQLERNVQLRQQASVDILQSMPSQDHFWDRLTMEHRRAMTMKKTLTLLLVQSKHSSRDKDPKQREAAWGEAAKAMSGKLRPTDSIYNLSPELFAIVLPETDTLNAKRVAVRLQEQLQAVRAKYDLSMDISVHNFPEHVQSSHELEDIVKSLLPEKQKWELPAEPQPA
ncbi:MAG TPA: diguanylate cyclase [Candidatus Acidoferrum sp.]|nr:diguanylate cyclase [Candidatus Acidoferrum sp.]